MTIEQLNAHVLALKANVTILRKELVDLKATVHQKDKEVVKSEIDEAIQEKINTIVSKQ